MRLIVLSVIRAYQYAGHKEDKMQEVKLSRWNYIYIVWDNYSNQWFINGAHQANQKLSVWQLLDDLGAQGWDLVSAHEVLHAGNNMLGNWVYIMKRQYWA